MRSLAQMRGQAAASGTGCIMVSIEELNRLNQDNLERSKARRMGAEYDELQIELTRVRSVAAGEIKDYAESMERANKRIASLKEELARCHEKRDAASIISQAQCEAGKILAAAEHKAKEIIERATNRDRDIRGELAAAIRKAGNAIN